MDDPATRLGCIEHDGGECRQGSGVYVFADGGRYEGTFLDARPLEGRVHSPWAEPDTWVPMGASVDAVAAVVPQQPVPEPVESPEPVVADVGPPPTPQELAEQAEERRSRVATRIREPERWAHRTSGFAMDVLTSSQGTAQLARQAQGAFRQTGYSLDEYGDCPAAHPGIQAARALMEAVEGADSRDPLVVAVALESFGATFRHAWAAPAAELANCYGVDLPPPVEAAPPPPPGPRVRVMKDAGFEGFVTPPPGWRCEVDQHCEGPAGIARMLIRYAPDGIEALVDADWAAVKRGCTQIDPLEVRQMSMYCDEGDADSDRRQWTPRSIHVYRQIPNTIQVVEVRAYAPDWGDANLGLVSALIQSTELVGGDF